MNIDLKWLDRIIDAARAWGIDNSDDIIGDDLQKAIFKGEITITVTRNQNDSSS